MGMNKTPEEVMLEVQEHVQKVFADNFRNQMSNNENIERLRQALNSFLLRMIAEGGAPKGSRVEVRPHSVDPTIVEWNIVDKNGVPLIWEESGED